LLNSGPIPLAVEHQARQGERQDRRVLRLLEGREHVQAVGRAGQLSQHDVAGDAAEKDCEAEQV
jgi:hypothetical protein